MNFGHFNDETKEYVIKTPATPLPWINYLGNDGFFGLISNTCGGYTFYKDAKLRSGGRLSDLAPTLLQLLNLPVPAGMTGKSLIEG